MANERKRQEKLAKAAKAEQERRALEKSLRDDSVRGPGSSASAII